MEKSKPCLYLRTKAVGTHWRKKKRIVIYCWMKPGKKRTLNVCRNCLLAYQVEGYNCPRTPQQQPKEFKT